MRYIIVYLALLFIPDVVFSQHLLNLKNYVVKNSLFDYGYGLERHANPGYDFFSFNSFIDPNISFWEIHDDIYETQLAGRLLKIKILERKDLLDRVVFYEDGKSVFQYKYANDLRYKSKAYIMKYRNDMWFVLFAYPKFLGSTTLIRNDGLLINLNTYKISMLPGWQSSNSLLCFTDYDMDGKLDYMQLKGGIEDTVSFFQFKDCRFNIDRKYYVKLLTIDNRLYFWDTLKSNLPPAYHAFRK